VLVTRAPVSMSVMGAMTVIYLVWGSTYLAVAFVVDTMPPLIASGLRFVLAGLLIGGLVWGFRGRRALFPRGRAILTAGGIGIIMIGIGNAALALAVRYVDSGLAALIIAITPVWIALLRLTVGQRPAVMTWLGIAIGLVGVVALIGPSDRAVGSVLWAGVLIAGSVAWAFASFLTTRVEMPPDAFAGAAWEMLIGGGASLLMGVAVGEQVGDLWSADSRSWIAFGYLSVVAALEFAVYVWLLTNAPISLVATYAYVNPVVAVTLGVLFNGERVTVGLLTGGVIVLLGVVLVVGGERPHRAPAKDSVPAGHPGDVG